MKRKQSAPADAADLRRRAEERVKARQQSPKSEADAERLLHELQVHQLELEMQNEELQQVQAELETALEQFTDLYDFAPAGYLTFDREGLIRQVNLAGAHLLGVERSRLVNQRFGPLVAEGDRGAFRDFLQKAFASPAKECCEVTLAREGLDPLVLQIEGAHPADGQECRAVVLDVSARKRAKEVLEQAQDEPEQRVAERTEELRRANEELRTEITGRMPAEAALRQSEARYAALFEHNPIEAIVVDLNGRIQAFNRAKRESGDPLPQIGEVMYRGYAGKHTIDMHRELMHCIQSGESRHYPQRAYGERILAIDIAPFPDGAIITSQDITVRKQVEEALQFTRFSLDNTTDSMVCVGRDGRFTDVNETFCRASGYSREEVFSMSVHDIDPDYSAEIWAEYWEKLKQNGSLTFESRHRTKEGKVYPVEIAATFFEHNGKEYHCAFVRDITERKRMEAAVHKEHQRFNDILEKLPVMICPLTPDYHVPFANRRFRELFGEAHGRRCFEYILHRTEPCPECQSFTPLKTHAPHHWERTTPMGTSIDIYNFPFADVDGSPLILEMDIDITERKRAEEALRESEAKYRALFNESADGILIADIETKTFKYANPALCRMLGYTEDELRTMGVADIHPKDAVQTAVADFEARVRGDKTLARDIPCLRKDGSVLHADINTFTITVDDRPCNVGFFRDITERKRAEDALCASEERFRIAAETTNDVVYEWDLKQGIRWFGDVDKMLGYGPGEFPRTLGGWVASVHPEDRERVMAAVQAQLDALAPYVAEYRVRRKDGVYRWWSARAAVTRAPDGKPVRWIGSITDITARKRGEEALRESGEKYRTLVENLPQRIFLKDPRSVYVSCNHNYALDLGIAPDALAGKTDFDLYPRQLAEKYRADDQRVMQGDVTEELEEAYVRDGKPYWVHTVKTPVFNEAGECTGVLGIFWDITERKRAEEALRALSLQLTRAQDEERRRIARELHDSAGQKLAALSMTVGLLQDAASAPGGKTEKMFADCLAIIEECAQEIRTFSYLLHPPLLDELGLAAAISDYVEGFSKRSGVRVVFDAPPGLERLPDEVELALFRVVQESLGNIHRHASAAVARIHLACDEERVTLEVSDQGRGMSAETIRAIEAGHPSVGVGIAGMRERLRLLGGRLEIESGGQGTTVRAIIPRRQEPT